MLEATCGTARYLVQAQLVGVCLSPKAHVAGAEEREEEEERKVPQAAVENVDKWEMPYLVRCAESR
jgi:hypothetical protein